MSYNHKIHSFRGKDYIPPTYRNALLHFMAMGTDTIFTLQQIRSHGFDIAALRQCQEKGYIEKAHRKVDVWSWRLTEKAILHLTAYRDGTMVVVSRNNKCSRAMKSYMDSNARALAYMLPPVHRNAIAVLEQSDEYLY